MATRTGVPMIFNLQKAIGEQPDLAATSPAKVKELQAACDAGSKEMPPAPWVRQHSRPLGADKTTAQGVSRAGGIEARFPQFDRNKDGQLTPNEFPRADNFKQMDKNADGTVTIEEAKAFYGNRRQQKTSQNRGRSRCKFSTTALVLRLLAS